MQTIASSFNSADLSVCSTLRQEMPSWRQKGCLSTSLAFYHPELPSLADIPFPAAHDHGVSLIYTALTPALRQGEDVVGQPESPGHSGHRNSVFPPDPNGLSVEEGWSPWNITGRLSGDGKTDTKQAKPQRSVLCPR